MRDPAMEEIDRAIQACRAELAQRARVVLTAATTKADLGRLAAAAAQASREARMEEAQAALYRGFSFESTFERLRGRLDEVRAKEEQEAAAAEARASAAMNALTEVRARSASIEADLARPSKLEHELSALVARKEAVLRAAADARLEDLTTFDQQVHLYSAHVTDLQAAFDLACDCRHGVGLLRRNPRGPWAGKSDLVFDGPLGWIATRRKYRHIDSYNADCQALRDLLRELDASPVVRAPELVNMVPSRTVSDSAREMDHWTEFLGGDNLAAAAEIYTWSQTRTAHSDLDYLDGKLSWLQANLTDRIKVANERIAGWQEKRAAFIETL